MKTPLIDFAPKAISTLIACQNILAEYIVPDSGITPEDCINKLLHLLDNRELIKQMKELELIK